MMLFILAALACLTGCTSRNPANVRHATLAIFEVIDCKTSGAVPVSLKGSTEKYCLAAQPVVSGADLRLAQARRDESGKPQLLLYLSAKAGERMRETTRRMNTEHLSRNDQVILGIVVDGTLVSAPILHGEISDSLLIEGPFSWEDALQIADSLNAPPK